MCRSIHQTIDLLPRGAIARVATGLFALVLMTGGLLGNALAATDEMAQPAAEQDGAGAAQIRDVQFGLDGATTIINLRVDRRVRYEVATLPEPYRVIIDVKNAGFVVDAERPPAPAGIITAARFGNFSADRSRIVLDTRGPARVEMASLVETKGGFVLAVALSTTDARAFGKEYRRRKRREAIRREQEPRAPASARPLPARENRRPVVVIDPGHGGIDSGAVAIRTVKGSTPKQRPRARPQRTPASRPSAFPSRESGGELLPEAPRAGAPEKSAPSTTQATTPAPATRVRAKEKDIVLAFSLRLRDVLRRSGKYTVHLTRTRDVYVPLAKRVQFARNKGADLFISVHADSVGDPRFAGVSGTTVYTLSEKGSDAAAQEFAARENNADALAGVDMRAAGDALASILIELAQRETNQRSERFARGVLARVGRQTRLNRGALRSAGFVVLKAPDVPSVLIELGFLSNRADEVRLLSPAWRNKVAAALASAVDRYFAHRDGLKPY
ncbi:MAG: N-acetylmuramoyl-L-alanine amidase [Pseudomonadota bacterium]